MSSLTAQDSFADVPTSARLFTLLGYGVLALFGAIFLVWGYSAPIAGAVIAPGVFVATGQNKVVQHLEGGVIREILVREGDIVMPGQRLIELDPTGPEAELRRLALRETRALTMQARLHAEVGDTGEFVVPDEVLRLASGDMDLEGTVENQRLTFLARRKSIQNDISVMQEGISALEERLQGGRTQLAAVQEQMDLIDEELNAKLQLLTSGIVRKPEVLALQRARASLRGEAGRLQGDIGDTKERISRAHEQIVGVKNTASKTAVEQLNEVRAELTDVRERMRGARAVLNRIGITAPVHGTVVKLRYHTAGGVIEAGKPILEIVPLEADLLIEVQVRPQDIDHVKAGLDATVRLTTLSQRITPMVPGKVVYVSADALPNDKRGQTSTTDSYVARIKLDAEKTTQEVKGFSPTAGMPAEVYITSGERSFLEYLMRPVANSLARAFREH